MSMVDGQERRRRAAVEQELTQARERVERLERTLAIAQAKLVAVENLQANANGQVIPSEQR